jgi:hypothetical protein
MVNARVLSLAHSLAVAVRLHRLVFSSINSSSASDIGDDVHFNDSQSGNLKTHQNTHTGERPYACKFPGCARAFGQVRQVRSRNSLHVEIIVQGTNLRKHEASHLRDRPRSRNLGVSMSGITTPQAPQNSGTDSKFAGGARFHPRSSEEETVNKESNVGRRARDVENF